MYKYGIWCIKCWLEIWDRIDIIVSRTFSGTSDLFEGSLGNFLFYSNNLSDCQCVQYYIKKNYCILRYFHSYKQSMWNFYSMKMRNYVATTCYATNEVCPCFYHQYVSSVAVTLYCPVVIDLSRCNMRFCDSVHLKFIASIHIQLIFTALTELNWIYVFW